MNERTKEKKKEKEEIVKQLKNFFGNTEVFTEKNCKIRITGIIKEEFKYSFTEEKTKYYRTYVEVIRKSNQTDILPVVISEKFKDINWKEKVTGKKIQITGQIRSRNPKDEYGKSHLDLYAFVTSAKIIYDENQFVPENIVYICGNICKKPIFRRTPRKFEITELLMAVNRKDGCSDYFPCITWFEDAYVAQNYMVGEKLEIYGRFQSRTYHNGEKVTYEISVKDIEAKSI